MADERLTRRGQAHAPYQYQFQFRQRAEDTQPAGRRRRRASPPPRRGSRLPWLRLLLIAAALGALAAAILHNAQADRQLRALRAERQALREEHERLLGYYVQMRRASGFEGYIDQYAQEFQVDRSFISAVISRESHYDKDARAESTGALGLMQVMQTTGEWIAGRLGVPGYQHERMREPDLNIRFGTWYLSYLSSQFGGDPVMVASAYHAGANNVKLWAMNYADDRKTLAIGQIPKDNTRDYVQKVMEAYALYHEYDSARR